MARTTASAPPPDDEAPDIGSPTAAQAAAAATATDEAPPPPPAATEESAFFSWLRSLGVQRQSGWLGGVCGGIAARIGVDPLLVRGIAVVLAVVGAPVALVYAIAWFLLPDEAGTIHAKELGHGRVTRALPGIAAVFLLSFLPLTQGFWYAGALYWGDLGWGGAVGRIVWTLVLLVAIVVLVVWLARRASSGVTTVPATTDDRPESVPVLPADAAAADATMPGGAGAAEFAAAPAADPGEPPAPPADASAEELAAWKASQDDWQRQRAAWAAEQRRTDRERRQAEANARAQEALAAARERMRIRRLTRPRAHAGIVFLVLGIALVAGAISAFAAAQSAATRGAEWTIGAAVLVLVLGVGTVAVALGRRRSGALAVFSILAVLALGLAVALPTDRTMIMIGANYGIDTRTSGRWGQLAGTTSLYVPDRPDGRSAPVIDLWQLAGGVGVMLEEGATVRVELTSGEHPYTVTVNDSPATDDGTSSSTAVYEVRGGRLEFVAGAGEPDLVLRVWLGDTAYLSVNHWGAEEPLVLDPAPDTWTSWGDDGAGTDLLHPTPIPTPTETSTTQGEGN